MAREMVRIALLALAGLGLLALVPRPGVAPWLIWNASASVPLGLYLVRDARDLHRSGLVLARLPNTAAALAAKRRYLPLGVSVIKPIAALSGDEVCSMGGTITINGAVVAHRLAADHEGRPLPSWNGCRRLDGAHVFLLARGVQDSFDGRYFGPVRRDAVIGKVTSLWTW